MTPVARVGSTSVSEERAVPDESPCEARSASDRRALSSRGHSWHTECWAGLLWARDPADDAASVPPPSGVGCLGVDLERWGHWANGPHWSLGFGKNLTQPLCDDLYKA